MKLKVDLNGLTINYKNREIKTPITKKLNNNDDKQSLEMELRKQGIEYKINYPKNSLFNLSGKELPFGCYKDPTDKRDYNAKSLLNDNNLKSVNTSNYIYSNSNNISYRNEMSPVKNQGNLGSCVGFAVAAMKEWQEQKEYLQEIKEGNLYRREQDHYNLSEQWIYYKSKDIDPWPNQEGTSIRHALKQVARLGVPPEKGWRYNDSVVGEPEIWTHMISKWVSGGEYYRIEYNNLKESLLNFGPIVIGIACFREIFNVGYDGFVPYPNNPYEYFGGHAVCITGYDSRYDRYEFKNSWSPSWGNRGYGYVKGEYLRDFMLDAWVFLDINVTRGMLSNG